MTRGIRRQDIQWMFSAAVWMAMVARPNIRSIILAELGMLLFTAVGRMLHEGGTNQEKKSWKMDGFTLLICMITGRLFYLKWVTSSMLAGIAHSMHLSIGNLVTAISCAGILLAVYAVRTVLYEAVFLMKRLKARQGRIAPVSGECRISAGSFLFLFVTAAVTITICSKSSPLYLMNDWVDAQCFFTAGKSMMHGRVLYRDIVEQKGFYLYALHALAYLVSHTTFFGVYLLEIAAAGFFLVYAYRTAGLFCAEKGMLYAVSVLSAFIYGTTAFYFGDSAEEFCLVLLAYAQWIGMKALKADREPTQKEFFFIGLTSGIVLWTKYSILGFYLGWFVIPGWRMIRARRWKKLLSSVLAIFLGVCAATVPVLAYFVWNDALDDMWQVYFVNNLFSYAHLDGERNILSNVFEFACYAVTDNLAVWNIILLGMLGLCTEGAVLPQMIFCIMGMTLSVFCGSYVCPYYALVFAVFAPTALPLIGWLLAGMPPKLRMMGKWGLPACGVGLMLLLNNNGYMLKYTEKDLPQFAFKPYIDQVEEPTLLNYGFLDGGFYTVYDIVPHCKYFCMLNIHLPEMTQTQKAYVEQGMSDFVVTCDEEIGSELYACVAQKTYFCERNHVYRLYALKTLELEGAGIQMD